MGSRKRLSVGLGNVRRGWRSVQRGQTLPAGPVSEAFEVHLGPRAFLVASWLADVATVLLDPRTRTESAR